MESFSRLRAASLALLLGCRFVFAQDPHGGLEALLEQNRRLQEQVREQQQIIEAMNARLLNVLRATERHERELQGLHGRVESVAGEASPVPSAPEPAPSARGHLLRVSAEAGFSYFKTGKDGQFPEGEFRVDDPVLTFEAPLGRNAYFFSELKLLPRETNEEQFELGELYVEFEDVLSAWERPGLLNVRAGRLNVPFGEEYLVRGPVSNPLISHSLSDIWGCDEGVALHGRIGQARYVVAVQNGGVSRLRDFHSDKSVAARVSWDPLPSLHLSGSAMRTGKLSTADDKLSELWFGNGFFRALGDPAGTATFHANLFEGDARVQWSGGHLGTALGVVRFDDSDVRQDNARTINYGYVEALQAITTPLFVAARYSEIRAPGGYPLVGWGTMGTYFFRPHVLTDRMRRMSVGLGYRLGAPVVVKAEYTRETGRLTTGTRRDDEDFIGTQLGVRF